MQKVLPRLGRSEHTRSTGPTTAGCTCTTSSATAIPTALQRLAKELSYANGGVVLALGVEDGALVRYTLFDRGAVVDEYAVRAGVLTARCRRAT